MTIFEIVYNKKTYLLELTADGEVSVLYEQQQMGPDLIVNINTLPAWLVAKAQAWWEATR